MKWVIKGKSFTAHWEQKGGLSKCEQFHNGWHLYNRTMHIVQLYNKKDCVWIIPALVYTVSRICSSSYSWQTLTLYSKYTEWRLYKGHVGTIQLKCPAIKSIFTNIMFSSYLQIGVNFNYMCNIEVVLFSGFELNVLMIPIYQHRKNMQSSTIVPLIMTSLIVELSPLWKF